MENYYDYSGLFREHFEYLYDQVKNFSDIFFNELIELIERVYDNYTIILNKAENDEYEMLKTIAEVTRSEYINYINNTSDLIVAFENDTLIFLENILIELKNISAF